MKQVACGLNVLLAATAVLVTFGPLLAEKPMPWQFQNTISAGIALVWLAGAIGLLWRRRWAWWSCVFAISAVMIGFIAVVVLTFMAIKSGASHDPTDGYGYTFLTGLMFAAFSLLLLLGVVSLRSECFEMAEPENERGHE